MLILGFLLPLEMKDILSQCVGNLLEATPEMAWESGLNNELR
jgi:hypothetical protein